jgi:HEAT repeat protein
MNRWMLGSAALFLFASAAPGTVAAESFGEPAFATVPPPAWQAEDPADSLYRAGREALNQRQYRRAAELFSQLTRRYPRSNYAGDALYWEAFALYRAGELRPALGRLEEQKRRYPSASTAGDADALATRVRGELARQGDPASAERVVREAEEAGRADARAARETARSSRGVGRNHCDEDSDVKLAALNAVMQMDADRAMPLLTRVLARRDPGSECLRRKAVFLVAQQRTDSTEKVLLNAVRTDPDQEVREQAVFWLSQVPGPRTVALLDSLARYSTDEQLSDRAVFALSQHNDDRAREALRAVAERGDAPRSAREKAIFWLGQQEGGATYLRQLFPKLTDDGLRERVVFSVAQAGKPEDRRWLLDLVGNTGVSVELRKKALFWAAQSADIAQLDQLYKGLRDTELKEQVIFGYAQRKEPAALDRLIEIAKTEKEPELRKKALFWLGQSRDPRVVDVLEQFLNE